MSKQLGRWPINCGIQFETIVNLSQMLLRLWIIQSVLGCAVVTSKLMELGGSEACIPIHNALICQPGYDKLWYSSKQGPSMQWVLRVISYMPIVDWLGFFLCQHRCLCLKRVSSCRRKNRFSEAGLVLRLTLERETHSESDNIPLDRAGMLADPEGYRHGYNLPVGWTLQTAAEYAKTRKQILLSLHRVGMGRRLGQAESWGTLSSLPLVL